MHGKTGPHHSEEARRLCEEARELRRTDHVGALALARSALEIAVRSNDEYARMHSLHITGAILYHMSQFNEALDHLQQALPLFKRFDDKANVVTVMRTIGSIYVDMSAPDEALPLLLQALEFARLIGNEKEQTACLLHIAKVYAVQGDLEHAIDIYRDAESIALRTEDWHTAGIIYRNLGVNACRLHRYTDAVHYLRKALSLHHRIGSRPLIAVSLEALGSVFAHTDKPHKALRYYTIALRLQRESGMDLQSAVTLCNIGATLDFLGDSHGALEKTLEGLAIAKRIGAKEFMLQMHRQCADLYERSGDIAAANSHLHSVLDLTNELSESRRQQAVSMYQVRFDMERNRARQQELLRRLHEAEHTALRSQMNPHFISNALSAIQSLIMEGNADEAQRYLSLFARLIRKLFEQSRSGFISLEDEFDTLRLYLQMEKLRYETRFNFTLNILPPLDTGRYSIPPLIIQPLAENALLHGILPAAYTGRLTITAQARNDNSLCCIVEDNGIGLSAAAAQPRRYIKHGSSLGLKVVRERLALLEESTGGKAALYLAERTEGTGTRAELILPLLPVPERESES